MTFPLLLSYYQNHKLCLRSRIWQITALHAAFNTKPPQLSKPSEISVFHCKTTAKSLVLNLNISLKMSTLPALFKGLRAQRL